MPCKIGTKNIMKLSPDWVLNNWSVKIENREYNLVNRPQFHKCLAEQLVGINFHITAVREGTIFNVMQFLSLERVTGTLQISFGQNIPEVCIYFVTGNVTTAEFGEIVGDAVLDVMLCQEYAIKEVRFAPGRINQLNEQANIFRASSLSGVMLNVSKDVDRCESRTLIYGLIPLRSRNDKQADSLLQLLYNFGEWEDFLLKLPITAKDKSAPLPQCALIHRALSSGAVTYQTPLVSLRSLRPLLDIVQPMTEKETTNLRGYMRSLLPNPRATHMSIDRFYAFASAIESIAQRRSREVGDRARRAIHQLIQATTNLSETVKA